MHTTRRPRTIAILIATALVLLVAGLLYGITFGRNITGFFRIGDTLPLSPRLTVESPHIWHGGTGYDGQLFLTLALDPSLSDPGSLRALDNPRYRYRRIGYPALGYVLGLGHPGLIPYALVAINMLCIVAFVSIYSALLPLARPDKPHAFRALWGLALPGLWMTLILSTADLLGSTFFACCLLMAYSRHYTAAALALAFACLTRETYLATALAFAAYFYWQRKPRAGGYFLLCLLPLLAWLMWVATRLDVGSTGIQENLSIPFTGIALKLRSFNGLEMNLASLFEGGSFALTLFCAGALASALVASWRKPNLIHAAALPCLAIFSICKMQILDSHANYLRIFMDLWLLLLLCPDEKHFGHVRNAVMTLSALTSLVYVVNYIIS